MLSRSSGGLNSGWFQAQSAVDPQPIAKQSKTPPPVHTEGQGADNAGEWKLATARTSRRKRLLSKPEVPLQNLLRCSTD